MPSALESAIRQHVDTFVTGFMAALRAASLEEARAGTGQGGGGRTGSARTGSARTGSGRTGSARKPAAPAPRKRPVAAKSVAKGADTLLDDMLEALQSRPTGMRSEELRAVLGVEKGPFRVVAREAEDAGLIRRTGEKRATTFFAK